MRSCGPAVEVNLGRLRQELEWWLERWEREGRCRERSLEAAAVGAGVSRRLLGRLLAGGNVSVHSAEGILVAIDYRDGPRRHPETGRLLPLVIRSRYVVDGRARQPGETGRIKRLEFRNAKLSPAQLRAIYRLHIDGGVSLRELCRRGWEVWGYASEHAALNSVSDRLRSMGLQPRSRVEAVALSNQTRPGVTKPPGMSKNEWRRLRRARRRAVDPAFHAEELARLAALHEREAAQREEEAA